MLYYKSRQSSNVLEDQEYFFFFFYYCCAGWGYIEVFTKLSYNVSNVSFLNSPPSLLSFIPPSPNFWNSFNRYYFCIHIHVYTLFVPPSLHTFVLKPLLRELPLHKPMRIINLQCLGHINFSVFHLLNWYISFFVLVPFVHDFHVQLIVI
jgi:hypothetical protein